MSMGFFSKLSAFFAAMASGPEGEINRITVACACALDKGVPEEERLRRFREMAVKDGLFEGHYRLLLDRARDANKTLAANEHICMYIVAAATEVIALLGYDPGAPWLRTDEENARMESSCRLQRSRIDLGRIDKDNLRDLLFKSLGVKGLWQTMGDPRKQLVQITGLEVEARDAWWKAHPMPDNAGQNRQSDNSA